MNFEIFLGRFHPLVVHLPIGFLLLAAIMEGLSKLFKVRFKGLDLAISISLFCGGLGAILSAIVGYLLATGGGYDEETLFWHQWLGIGLALASFITWAVKANYIHFLKSMSTIMIVALVFMVSIVGHLGGNLTHGSDYMLAYAPESVRNFLGEEKVETAVVIPTRVDSIYVYEHLIEPMLAKKCYQCHNETKKKGGLLLETPEGMIEGGDTGENLIPGHASESQLFQRVTYPQGTKKFMPPKGEILSYSELKLLEWWINEEALFDAKLADLTITKEIEELLLRDYELDARPKALYDLIEAPRLAKVAQDQIIKAGFDFSPLATNHLLYEVRTEATSIKKENITALLKAKEQITWLSLPNKKITDDLLVEIGKMKNLTSLNLNKNPITDAGVQYLSPLKYLEVLNLFGTEITDKSLKTIQQMPELKRVYLWQTDVTNSAVAILKKNKPDLNIDLGN